MAVLVNGVRTGGGLGVSINGVENIAVGGELSGVQFYNITSDPPDITPEMPDDVRQTFSLDMPTHILKETPDIPGSTTLPTPLWSVAMATHVVQDDLVDAPAEDVNNLVDALASNIVHDIPTDLPVEDVDDLVSSLPSPVL